MTNLPTPADLRRETRDWLKRGVIPSVAAAARRMWAEQFPLVADVHEAYAAEWDRIAAKFPEKVIKAYEMQRDYAINCLSHQTPGSDLSKYWQDEAAKWDAEILKIDPEYCPR